MLDFSKRIIYKRRIDLSTQINTAYVEDVAKHKLQ